MKVLVTGAAGFIGSHLVERLLAQGNKVFGIDDFSSGYDPEVKKKNIQEAMKATGFELAPVDICNRGKLARILSGQKFDVVIHLAARTGVRPSLLEPQLYQEVNIGGSLNLLEAFKENQPAAFIFASSSSVYGASTRLPFQEDDPADFPLSPYAATKRAGELLCRSYSRIYHLPITCLRFFTVYGPRQRPDMAIHKFSRLIFQGKEISLYGQGDSARDYTYIDDIIEGIISALNKSFPFEIINLGDSRPVQLAKLVALLEKRLGKKARTLNQPAHPADPTITYAHIEKAQKLLDFSPKVELEEGIDRFIPWFLKNQPE